jgi:hypothetical protein
MTERKKEGRKKRKTDIKPFHFVAEAKETNS